MNLTAKKPVHINGGWVQAGQPVPYDVTGFNYEDAARRGLIESEDGEDIVNPEADAPDAPASDPEDVARLKEEHAVALKEASDRAATWERRAHEQDAKVATLTKDVARLQGELEKAQASAVKPEDAAALAEYREYVGELLPAGYPERKLLMDLGYLTTTQVEKTDDATLEAEKGLGDKKVLAIRKVTPYKPAGE